MDRLPDDELAYARGYREGFSRAAWLMNEQTEQLINQMQSLKEDKLKYGKHEEENSDR